MANIKNTTINDIGFIRLPNGTTGQRPSSPITGDMRYNSDFHIIEYFDGSSWQPPTIVTDSLILHLDASNSASYSGSGTTWFDISGNGNHVTLVGSPTHNAAQGFISFDTSSKWARTTNNLNLSSFNSVTVEVDFRANNLAGQTGMLFEHGPDWNSNAMSFGLVPNSSGSVGTPVTNRHHTNQASGTGARDYNGIIPNTVTIHTNIWSRISDSTGRLAYIDGVLRGWVSGSSSTGNYTNFRNDILWLSRRGANTCCHYNVSIYSVRVYGKKLSQAEIQQNFDSLRGRYGI